MYHQTLFMRKSKQLIMLVFIFSVGSAFAEISEFRGFTLRVSNLESKEVILENIKLEVEEIDIEINNKSLFNFMEDMAQRESSKNHRIVNKWGYSGLFQFSKRNIRKFAGVSQKKFLESPDIQRRAMIELLKHNKHNLRREIEKYNNKTVKGILVTESGILAAAHIAGSGNVRRWFRNGKNPKDKLGTSLEDYMKLFASYSLILE